MRITMGEHIIWLVIMIPVCLLLTGIGICALRSKKPMWFWSGTEVKAEEIGDVPAYNRANGTMWIAYSLMFWLSTAAGLVNMKTGGVLLVVSSTGGSVLLMLAYHRILNKYRAKGEQDGHSACHDGGND